MSAKSVVATTLLALAASTVATESAGECATGQVQCRDSTPSTTTHLVAGLQDFVGMIDVQSIVSVGSGAAW